MNIEATKRISAVAKKLAEDIRGGVVVPGTQTTHNVEGPVCAVGHLISRIGMPYGLVVAGPILDAMELRTFGPLADKVREKVHAVVEVNDHCVRSIYAREESGRPTFVFLENRSKIISDKLVYFSEFLDNEIKKVNGEES